MGLDGEGAANFEQLKDLIHKECDKQDCHYSHLEDKYKKLEPQVSNQDQQKHEGLTTNKRRTRCLEEKQI